MFAAFVDGVADGTVDQVSRFGGALLSLTGSGFVEPEVYFQVAAVGTKYPCNIVSYDYTSIQCKMVKIASLANEADQDLTGVVIVNGEG